MLNNKQKMFLKKYSVENNVLKINIGKNHVDNTVIKYIHDSLNSHEIIKLSILNNAFTNKEEKNELLISISEKLKFEVVNKIGNTILIYRSNPKAKNHIVLPL